MYNIDYQVTHDIDYFFIKDEKPIHIASNGGVLPDKLGSKTFVQKTQNVAYSLPMQFGYELNMDYLNQLNAEDFPTEAEMAESGFLQLDHYRQFDDTNLPFHIKLYAYSFVEMARRGFYSYDRLTDYSTDGLYNLSDESSVYQLIASPTHLGIDEVAMPRIGYQFSKGSVKCYMGRERWDFAAWILTSERIKL